MAEDTEDTVEAQDVQRHAVPEPLRDGSRVGLVHSAETTAGVNGPGLRYTVFLAGCPLRCQFCHNPDTQTMRLGQRTTVKRILAEVAKYVAFISPNGGLTLTGGEPLLQPDFVEDIFVGARDELGVHTTLDTSAANAHRASERLLDYTDLVLLDIKGGDPDLYTLVTGGGNMDDLLTFAARLRDRGTKMRIRFVLVPGLTDAPDNLERVADLCVDFGPSVDRVEVLPYHTLGVDKYTALGREYPLAGTPTPTQEQVQECVTVFRSRGLNTIV